MGGNLNRALSSKTKLWLYLEIFLSKMGPLFIAALLYDPRRYNRATVALFVFLKMRVKLMRNLQDELV